ncbi:MAG: hypothetical protein HOD92_25595 [Deltaproteobacteria bacterium]|nr:hypothetical protein [Deltaproteobacteria bacterium]
MQAKINNLMSEIHQTGIQQKEQEIIKKKKIANQEIQFNSANFITTRQFEVFKKAHYREIKSLKREIGRLKTKK